ncbi:hypothetical protein [Nocardia jejuensis]|uniref:hypothetical protein n=1 Tax=Nocardia jejuensis TaxID=328049 RepID=UPI00082AD6CB|nr:hypothetical protein [Nocardia jejuensis]
MPQPEFRRRITARIRRLPEPIPSVWALIDGLHYAADAVITLIERIHLGAHERPAPSGVPYATTTAETDTPGPSGHSRRARRVYEAARAAHWYI